jgi:hypothetical protein
VDKPFPAYRGDEPYVFVCYAHEDEDEGRYSRHCIHARSFNPLLCRRLISDPVRLRDRSNAPDSWQRDARWRGGPVIAIA